jgi:hypothetical protein
MVDAWDLKSLGGKPPSRFESGRRHQRAACSSQCLAAAVASRPPAPLNYGRQRRSLLDDVQLPAATVADPAQSQATGPIRSGDVPLYECLPASQDRRSNSALNSGNCLAGSKPFAATVFWPLPIEKSRQRRLRQSGRAGARPPSLPARTRSPSRSGILFENVIAYSPPATAESGSNRSFKSYRRVQPRLVRKSHC